jgi:Family of unknown function (DUF6455)
MRIFNHNCWMLDCRAPRPDLMERMIERMSVSPAAAARVDGGMALREARTKCIFCRREDVCAHWLDGTDGSRQAREFCPNVAFFEHCAASLAGLGWAWFRASSAAPRWDAHFAKLR